MTVIFKNVQNKPGMMAKFRENNVLTATFNEILYADDTIVFSASAEALQEYVQAIEAEGARYGMKLNRRKCEAMCIRGTDKIHFADGTMVPPHNEAKYLGCMLNDKGDPKREINKRLAECYLVWKRLAEFWKHSDCSVAEKLVVYDAVVRSKLIYGLESVQVNDSLKSKIDAFQLKGLRQILKIQTTFMNRENTNDEVFRRANDKVNERRPQWDRKAIIPISKYYELRRRKMIAEVIAANEEDPISEICLVTDTLQLKEHDKRRVGRPRNNWWYLALSDYFSFLKRTYFPGLWGQPFSFDDARHVRAIKEAVENKWGL